jgi:hypothetical protein
VPRIEGTKVGVDGLGREVWSPLLVVTMEVAGSRIQGLAIVDSGADQTMVPAEAIEALGLSYGKLPAGSAAGGAGGPFESRPLHLSISWKTWEYSGEIRVAQPKRLPVILLGRSDFFQDFVVRFTWHKAPPEFNLDPVAKATA